MASFNDILKRIEKAIGDFNKQIPSAQKVMLPDNEEELRRLDLTDGRIKPTVANIKVITSIKNKLLKIVLNEDYVGQVKQFIGAFNEVTTLQNEYWKSVESKFKPSSILKEVKTLAIEDTVSKLTEAGIGTNIESRITDVLKANITTGGSYKDLTGQLRELLTDTPKSDGLLTRYAKQITTDSINQYSANYTQIVSSDLGYEWYAYQGSDIKTTRPFCDAMTDFRYFHISEISRLLAARDLYYTKDGKKTKVPIYDKTGLPHGLIDGTNAANFFVRRGGYSCGHQIRPVSEFLVKNQAKDIYDRVVATQEYKNWKRVNSPT